MSQATRGRQLGLGQVTLHNAAYGSPYRRRKSRTSAHRSPGSAFRARASSNSRCGQAYRIRPQASCTADRAGTSAHSQQPSSRIGRGRCQGSGQLPGPIPACGRAAGRHPTTAVRPSRWRRSASAWVAKAGRPSAELLRAVAAGVARPAQVVQVEQRVGLMQLLEQVGELRRDRTLARPVHPGNHNDSNLTRAHRTRPTVGTTTFFVNSLRLLMSSKTARSA
jgi:hypothetical protein